MNSSKKVAKAIAVQRAQRDMVPLKNSVIEAPVDKLATTMRELGHQQQLQTTGYFAGPAGWFTQVPYQRSRRGAWGAVSRSMGQLAGQWGGTNRAGPEVSPKGPTG